MSYHSDQPFSTKDYNPNRWSITVCAMSYRGGWWYKNCHEANLNGVYGVTENHQVNTGRLQIVFCGLYTRQGIG